MTNPKWLAMVRKASPRQLEINDVIPVKGMAQVCQDTPYRFAQGQEVIVVKHSIAPFRRPKGDRDGVRNGRKDVRIPTQIVRESNRG